MPGFTFQPWSSRNRTVGAAGSEVTAHLLADGADTGKELKLKAGNGWNGTFDDLRKYKAGTAARLRLTMRPLPYRHTRTARKARQSRMPPIDRDRGTPYGAPAEDIPFTPCTRDGSFSSSYLVIVGSDFND